MGTGAVFRTTKWKLFVEDYKVNIQREFGPGLVDFTEETTRTFNGEKEISAVFKSLNLAFGNKSLFFIQGATAGSHHTAVFRYAERSRAFQHAASLCTENVNIFRH